MSKQKKTRQQKVIAELRRKLQLSSKPSAPQQIETKSFASNSYSLNQPIHIPPIKNIQYSTYTYLPKDLLKTTFITSSIIGIELLLLFLLKNRIFVIPNLNF